MVQSKDITNCRRFQFAQAGISLLCSEKLCAECRHWAGIWFAAISYRLRGFPLCCFWRIGYHEFIEHTGTGSSMRRFERGWSHEHLILFVHLDQRRLGPREDVFPVSAGSGGEQMPAGGSADGKNAGAEAVRMFLDSNRKEVLSIRCDSFKRYMMVRTYYHCYPLYAALAKVVMRLRRVRDSLIF